MKVGLEVEGLEPLIEELNKAGDRFLPQVVRTAVHSQASQTAKEIKKAAPVLSEFDETNRKGKTVRKKGVLKNAVKAKRRRQKGSVFASDVQMSEGRNAKYDAWYWHFVEYGTVKVSGRNFVEPAKTRGRQQFEGRLKNEFNKRLIKKIQKVAR